MKKATTREERTQQLLTEPVDKLVNALALPSIASMLITNIYNTADTYFVSQLGTSASGAVGIIFSLMAIVQAFAFLIGQGAGNNMSRALGAGNKELAERYVAVCFFTEFITGTVLAILALIVMKDLVFWLGATDTIAPYAAEYARYIVVGFPFIMSSFGINNILRFQGNSNLGAIGMMTGGILNMALDPICIFTLGMGTKGAAVATTASQIVSFIILTTLSNRSEAAIKIRLRNFRPTWDMYKKIIHIGLPSLARQSIMSISTIVFNHCAHPYGDACIAASSIVNRYVMLLNSVIIGVGQGFQPVCGTNLGAGRRDRVIGAYYYLVKVSFVLLMIFAVVSFIFARPIVTIFRKEDEDVIRIGSTFLRLQALMLPLSTITNSVNMLAQTSGYGVKAAFLSALRQGICLMPLVLILPKFMGLLGLQLCQPIADVISCIITFIFLQQILNEMKAYMKADGQTVPTFFGTKS